MDNKLPMMLIVMLNPTIIRKPGSVTSTRGTETSQDRQMNHRLIWDLSRIFDSLARGVV